MNEEFTSVVELIVQKSPRMARQALGIMRSSAPELRLRAIAPHALEEGEWTDEERSMLFNALGYNDTDEDRRTKSITFRATPDEFDKLNKAAEENGTSLSDSIRVTLGL